MKQVLQYTLHHTVLFNVMFVSNVQTGLSTVLYCKFRNIHYFGNYHLHVV